VKGLGGAAVVCLLLTGLLAAPTAALDLGEWIPGLTLSPFLGERVEYETNVFQTPSHSQSDVIFKTIPGFLADYTFGPHSLSGGYRAEILNYVNLTSQNTTNHYFVTQLRLDFPRLLVNTRDDFADTSDPPGTELTGPIKSQTNVLAHEVEYALTQRFSVGGNFSWTYVNFQQSVDELDRNEYLGGASVFWHFLPKADLQLNYSYGAKDFSQSTDGNRNVTRHVATLALRGDLTAKITSTFRLGFEVRNPEASNGKAYTGLIGGGDWIYRPTERTTITLNTDRSVQESTFQTEPYYVSTSAALGARHRILPKLTLGVRAAGGFNDYPLKETVAWQTKFRQDTFYAFGGGVDYEIQRWLLVGIEFAHRVRRSNFNAFDFVDDKISGKITLQF
jgi:hypothetical protein